MVIKNTVNDERYKGWQNMCREFVEQQGFTNFKLIGSYNSYMAGLQFHQDSPRPRAFFLYNCLPEPTNPYDENAIGVFDRSGKRIAYVPRQLAQHIKTEFEGGLSKNVILVCFCKGKVTTRSAQCFYNLYTYEDTEIKSHHEHKTCVTCFENNSDTLLVPCGHKVLCQDCSSRLIVKICPICRESIRAIQVTQGG